MTKMDSPKNDKKKVLLANKQFQPRESLLTTLIANNPHVCSLHNIILAFVLMFTFTTIGDYFSHPDRFAHDYSIVAWNLSDFWHFVKVWILMNAALICLLYPLVVYRSLLQYKSLCAWLRSKVKEQTPDQDSSSTSTPKIYSEEFYSEALEKGCKLNRVQSFLIGLAYSLITAVCIIFHSSWYIFDKDMNITCTFAITMEMTRLAMKGHSYFIEKWSYSMENKELEKLIPAIQQSSSFIGTYFVKPKLSKFIYYLFAPTLIYRDSYPRNEKIRWKFVLEHFFQMLLCIMVCFVSVCRFLVDTYSTTGLEPFRLTNLSRNFSSFFIFGGIQFMLCFYVLQHLWHNITGELLRFADRRYYDAWWESISLKEYYRKWNTIVQDWLFAYIYVPTYNWTNNQTITSYTVIFISGIVHEYIVAISMRFFFPALFFAFAITGHIYFLLTRNLKRTNVHNSLFMAANIFGWGLLSTLYSIEWYSRINCPPSSSSKLMDLFVPRMISCVEILKSD